MPSAYFLDTSALLPRFLRRAPGYAWVRHLYEPASGNLIAIAEITEAELASALNQLVRGKVIRRKSCDATLAAFWDQVDASEYHIIAVSSPLVRQAADLCRLYALRGYDAVQLAAALTFRDDARLNDAALAASGGTPLGDPIFLAEDRRLADAAAAEGFAVGSPAAHP